MKFTQLAIAFAVAGLMAAPAFAQNAKKARTVAYAGNSYDYYAAEEPASPSDNAPAPAGGVAVPAPEAKHVPGPCESCITPSCGGCNSCCDSGCDDCELKCCEHEAWSLFGDCCHLKCKGITIAGWINGGYTYNSDNPASRYNGTLTFNDRDEEGQLNQVYVYIQKEVETDGCCWDVGYRVDALYGTDSRFTKALGLELHQDGNDRWNSERFYQLSMPQVYAEFGRNDWSVKVGRFYTIIGYEVVTAPDNFFYSRAYHMQYAEPFTHTGVLATKKVNDQFSFSLGVVHGWDQWEDANDDPSILAGVNFANEDGTQKLALAITSGDEIAPITGVNDNRTMASAVYTLAINPRTTYIIQSDFGRQQGGAALGAQDAEWYGVNQYLLYQLSCDWWAGGRFEWFRDDDGTRVSSINSGTFGSGNVFAAGPFEGEFTQISLGLNYKPNGGKNLIVRPEVRWDHFNGTPGNPLPFDDGTKDDQFTAAIDAIFKF